MSYHMEVDPKFYMAGEKRPEATNVGELKAILNELPDDLPVGIGFSPERLVVRMYNARRHDSFLTFEEPDDDDD